MLRELDFIVSYFLKGRKGSREHLLKRNLRKFTSHEDLVAIVNFVHVLESQSRPVFEACLGILREGLGLASLKWDGIFGFLLISHFKKV